MVLTAPYVPETLVVHLGYPSAAARNVRVSFWDYIKNVASSEIYPTWPEASLRANILAQISFTMNRIYTEWYRSQGYDFDITSTTQFDHSFVYEREIFDTISRLVDELFTTYMREIGQVAPFPAPYCDGYQTRCSGMEQWGTVALAEEGLNSVEILHYYYGDDIELVTNAPVRSYSPSYPGTPLDYGDYSNYVLIIQYQLNRIAVNYPALPKISPADGWFNLVTVASVRRFQSIFGLQSTGIVDEATWYQISYIYSVVKRLSELETEGVEYASFTQPLPVDIGLGYTGEGLDHLQYYLEVIGMFNQEYPEITPSGVFDQATQEAVEAIQRNNGLPVTGRVDLATWNLLYEIFLGIALVVSDLPSALPIVSFDGVLLRQGSTSERVELLQEYLNAIAKVYTEQPPVEVLGVFDAQTYRAVVEFQRLFGLADDGIVGRETWNMLVDVYESTLRRLNPALPQFPGYTLQEGMSDPV